MHRRGYTLTELMVVLAIVSTLQILFWNTVKKTGIIERSRSWPTQEQVDKQHAGWDAMLIAHLEMQGIEEPELDKAELDDEETVLCTRYPLRADFYSYSGDGTICCNPLTERCLLSEFDREV